MKRFLIEVTFRQRPTCMWFLVEDTNLHRDLAKATVSSWMHCRTPEEWNFTACYDVTHTPVSAHAERVIAIAPVW